MTATIHVVPVGLSLLTEGKLVSTQAGLLGESPSAGGVQQLLQNASDDTVLDLDALLTRAQQTAAVTVGSDACAEWSALGAVAARPGADPRAAHVLVASDTDDGLRAAVFVAARFGRSVRYLDDPAAVRGDGLEPGEVVVCRIPDLDLGERRPTDRTWTGLAGVGRLVADTAAQAGVQPWDVVLHLSGGYKALIPYLMQWGEAVHSRLRDVPAGLQRSTLRAVALHRPSVDDPRQVLVEVPVRAVEGELLDEVKQLRDLVEPGSSVVPGHPRQVLKGLYWEPGRRGSQRLTASGLMMVNVW